MKISLLSFAVLSCLGSAALAGPNAHGSLIVALSEGTVYTTENTGYCGTSTTEFCEAAITTWSGGDPAVLNILAAIPVHPRLAGLTFGVVYTPGVAIIEGESCGDFELPDDGWPASGTGNAVTWSSAQTDNLIECYWFAAYNYSGESEVFSMTPHPTQGGWFADDDVPSNLDPIVGYGQFGFNTLGGDACAHLPVGACCLPDGTCVFTDKSECEEAGGSFQGAGVICDYAECPQPTGACCIDTACIVLTADDCAARGGDYKGDDIPCLADTCTPPVPTVESSWGAIKNDYR